MVTTRSTPAKRRPSPSSPSASRAEDTTQTLNNQIRDALIVPTSPADLPSLPTLDDAPPAQAARSHLVLAGLILGCVALGWLVGFDLLQFQQGGTASGGGGVVGGGGAAAGSGTSSWFELAAYLGGFAALLLGALHWVGIAQIDFWAMLNGYWWLSVPVAVAALAAVTVMQERASELHEVE